MTCLLATVVATTLAPAQVKTTAGLVQATAPGDGQVRAFGGIRFAAVTDHGASARQTPPASAQSPRDGTTRTPQQPRGVVPKFATRQILDDVYQIAFGGDMISMYVLVGRDKALVVDTHMIPEDDGVRIVDRVKAITDKPLIVVNTHSHPDHIGANDQFGEVHASTIAVEEIRAAAKRRGAEVGYSLKAVKNGDVFDLGDRQVEVIDIPAHSAGSVALLDRKDGYLFTGDEIDPGQVVGINEANVGKHYANMKMLYEKYYARITHLVPAHNGAPVTRRYVKYFMDLDAKIIAGTAPVVPIADGPNFNFPTSDRMVRYRENGAAIIFTKR